MGWSHPDTSLDDLMKVIKGFVDILILTSGYQSSGRPAHWDPNNIKKALQWALFFENVLSTLSSLGVYQDSINELDMALSKIISAASFPQGLAHLSSSILTKAREFLIDHFLHTLPLRDSHLRAFLIATTQMDLDKLSGTEHDRLSAYLSKLKLQHTKTYSVQDFSLLKEAGECDGDSFTNYAVQKLLKRWSAVSDISTIEKSLKTISDNIMCSSWKEFDDNLFKEQLKQNDAPVIVEQLVGFMKWNHWKLKSISYFLDKKAIRMFLGASMIFSAPKIQWAQVLDRLNVSAESRHDNLHDTELLLLGCISSRWTNLIERLMSVSHNSISTSEQDHEVCKLLPGKFHTFESKKETTSSKENDILEYLTGKLGGQLHSLWNISPALAAVSLPSWSLLFWFF